MVAPDLAAVIAGIDELNAMCRELRAGYLHLHPDAPATAREREMVELAISLWRQHGRDLRPGLGHLPRSLRQRLDAAMGDPSH
ncbi:MAG: hypothetical protein H0W72_11320 [Planctomycetes bacterium]|nr:hypothetical protein [Planctomycetota bacterium]